MKISQLEYILAVEKTGSINLAAEQLFVSQSRVSLAVTSLEEELGQPLFLRSNKGITLTSFGQEFLPYAHSVVAQINQMKALGKENAAPRQSLMICSNDFRFSAELCAEFYNRHRTSGITINLKDCSRQQGIDLVSNHLAELAIERIWSFQHAVLNRHLKTKNVEFFPLTIMPLAVVVGEKNPLFSHDGDSITLSMLRGFDPVIFDYSQYNPTTNIYDHLPELGFKNHISVSTLSAASILIQQTDAYILTTASANPTKNTVDDIPGCRILQISDCDITGQIGWMKHKSTILSPLARDFLDLLCSYLQN